MSRVSQSSDGFKKSDTHLIRIAYDLLPITEISVGRNTPHPILKTLHGLAAPRAKPRATTINSQAAGEGNCGKGAEDGCGRKMHFPLLIY